MRPRGLLAALITALVVAPAASAAEVWPADPQATIFPMTTRPAEAPKVLVVPAARAEYEGGIVAVRPDTAMRITPTVSDLKGPGVIPSARIARYRIGYVGLSRPSTGVDRLAGDGRYPDPLIPIAGGASIVLPAGETTQIYLRVHVPENAAAGRYRGVVDLGPAGSLPVRVDVAPVRVDRGSYPLVARLDELALARAHGVDERDPALIEGVYSSLLPELAALGVSPGEPPFTTPAANPATWALDYSSPLGGRPGAPPPATILARYERFGFAQTEVPFLPTFPTAEDRAFVNEPRRRVLARDLGTAFAPSAGRTFALPVDEPTPQTYERLRRAAGQLGDAVPRIRLLATEAPHPGALAAIGDVVDIWAPPLWDLFKVPEGLGAVRARGASLWWYVYGSETQRYTPNVLIDKPTTEPRLMGWLAAREGVEGFFYWGLNGWDRTGAVQSPWQDAWYQSHVAEDVGCGTRVVGGNGEASLLYPGPGPHRPAYTSLRLEALRDGAEDHSLLTRLRAEDPARFARLVGGLVTPYSGRAEQGGRVGCDDNHRPAYLPVVETDPDALRSARVAMLAAFSATPLPTLRGVVRFAPGRGPQAGRPVDGARVRFGAFTTTTDARGRWRLRGVSRVPGRLTVSRDPNGRIDPVSVRITSEMLAAPRIRVVTPRMRVRPSRALVTDGGLVEWRGRIGAARASRRGQTVRMTMARSYRPNGDERRFDAGVAPTVTAEFERRLETRTLRDWRGYRHLEFVAEVVDPAAEPYHLIVTPGDYRNARKVAVGSRRQLVRVPLGQMRRKNAVGKLTFGIQSAVPKVWRGGHRLRATVVVKDLRLVR